jgi:hypothetical protein
MHFIIAEGDSMKKSRPRGGFVIQALDLRLRGDDNI